MQVNSGPLPAAAWAPVAPRGSGPVGKKGALIQIARHGCQPFRFPRTVPRPSAMLRLQLLRERKSLN